MIRFICSKEELPEVNDFILHNREVGFDTETSSELPFNGQLLAAQIGNYDVQFVLDIQTIGTDVLNTLQLLTKTLVVGHNLKFDWKWLYHYGIDIKNIFDTFIAECILTTGLERTERHLGLDKCVKKYTGGILNKTVRGAINYEGFTPKVIEYCAGDVRYLLVLKKLQIDKLREWYSDDVLIDLEMKTVRVLSMMEYNGITLDPVKWKEVYVETTSNRADIENKLDNAVLAEPKLSKFVNKAPQLELFFEEIAPKPLKETLVNWSSNKQKHAILNALGIVVKKVDEKALLKIRAKHKIISQLIKYNKATKLSTSFGEEFLRFINPVTGRIHANFFQIIASGRISSNNPNLLNIPIHVALGEKIRGSFVAKEGFSLIDTDFSAMELRLIAEYANEPSWTDAFINNEDLHAKLCAATFEIPLEDVTKPFYLNENMTYRFVQKTINFMTAYGGSEFKLSEMLDIPKNKAKQIIDKFFSVVPNVQKILEVWAYTALTRGYIMTAAPYKRVRWFPKFNELKELEQNPEENFIKIQKITGEIARPSRNQIPQGSNANIIKEALCMLQDEIDKNMYPVELKLAVYDEIVAEVRDDYIDIWKPIQESIMIEAAQKVLHKIPVKVETVVAKYWKH